MNLQILAFEDAPLAAASSGIAGFIDAGVIVATHNGASKLTLAIANRNGKFASPVRSTPDLITPARWVQMGIQWWPQ